MQQISVENYRIPRDIFWVKKNDVLKVVKETDDRIFTLEGIARDVFLHIAQQDHQLSRGMPDLIQQVLTNLLSLKLIALKK